MPRATRLKLSDERLTGDAVGSDTVDCDMATPRPHLPLRFVGPAPSNVEVVAAALREAIINGRLGPGARIKEVPIARQLGVSRGPIREAIQLLEHDGLLKTEPNRGAVVPVVSSADVLEVYAMRASLGSLALHKLMLAEIELPIAALRRELQRFERAVTRGKAAAAGGCRPPVPIGDR